MAGRDTVHMQAQIGVEVSHGTEVPATIILPATSFQTGIRADISSFRPEGQKYITVAPLDREWTEVAVRGRPCYTDFAYLLSAIMSVPSTSNAGAVEATLTTDLVGDDNDLVYTAVTPGTAGNSITIAYVATDPDQVLAVGVVGSAITVTLATDAASAITSTADDVAGAIALSGPASALVTVANALANNGTGLVTAMGATNLANGSALGSAYQHIYSLNRSGPDLIRTFSVEQGDPSAWQAGQVKAQEWNYGLITELGTEWRRTAEPTVTGRMIGRQLQTKAETMTAGTMLEAVPVLSGDISLYVDSDLVDIGTTQLLDVSRVTWRLGNRFNPRWAINRDEASWTRHTEMAPELAFTLLMGADAAGMSPLAQMREGATTYMRLEAISAVVADTGIPYAMNIDMAVKVTAIEDFNDDEGTYSIGYTFTGTPTLAGNVPCIVTLVNDIASI